jgi:hypothetical protein
MNAKQAGKIIRIFEWIVGETYGCDYQLVYSNYHIRV